MSVAGRESRDFREARGDDVLDAARARDGREVAAVRRAEERLEEVLVLRHGQVREDAAAAVLEEEDRERRAQVPRRAQPARVVEEREVARDEQRGPAASAGHADRRRDDAVDAVGAAVREHLHALGQPPGVELRPADGHAAREEQRGALREHRAGCRDGGRFARRAIEQRPRPGFRDVQRLRPVLVERDASHLGRERLAGRARARHHHLAHDAVRVAAPVVGLDRDDGRAVPLEPRGQRLRGRDAAQAQDEVGREIGHGLVAQEEIGVRAGDDTLGNGCAAQSRGDVGEDGHAGRAREGEHGGGPGAVDGSRAGNDQRTARLRDARGQRGEHGKPRHRARRDIGGGACRPQRWPQ